MTPEQRAADELAGFSRGLIECGVIAPHMVPGFKDKVNAYFRASRLPEPFPFIPVCNDNTSIAAFDDMLDRISEVMA